MVGVVNPVPIEKLPAANFVDFAAMGGVTAKGLVASLGSGETANVVTFPGPAGSGWAESFNEGFKKEVSGNANVKILDEKFGDSGVAVQLQLIQDALQTYPDMNVIWGTAPTAEAAIGAVAEAGRTDMKVISSYENQAMLDASTAATSSPSPRSIRRRGAIGIDQRSASSRRSRWSSSFSRKRP